MGYRSKQGLLRVWPINVNVTPHLSLYREVKFGNAGCWSGSYGKHVPLDDLARYALSPDTLFI